MIWATRFSLVDVPFQLAWLRISENYSFCFVLYLVLSFSVNGLAWTFESNHKTSLCASNKNNERIYDHHISVVDRLSFKQKDTQQKTQTLEVVETFRSIMNVFLMRCSVYLVWYASVDGKCWRRIGSYTWTAAPKTDFQTRRCRGMLFLRTRKVLGIK